MRRYLPIVLLVIAGCSQAASSPAPPPPQAAPKYPALAAGTLFMVSGSSLATVFPPDGGTFPKSEREFLTPWVDEGDRGLVIEDFGVVAERARKVKVRMESGKAAGRSFLMFRADILPLSTPLR